MEWIDSFLESLACKARVFTEVERVFRLDRDPKDEPYINLALAAGSRYLVTRDRDLLDLMKDDGFRQQFSDLTILDPSEFLVAVARQTETE